MRKQDITDFLWMQRNKKMDELNEKFKQDIRAAESIVLKDTGLADVCATITGHLQKAQRALEKWADKNADNVSIQVHFDNNYGLHKNTRPFTEGDNACYTQLLDHVIGITTPELEEIAAEHKRQKDCMEASYRVLFDVIYSTSSIKQIQKTVSELGFDLSELESRTEKRLAKIQLDPAMLVPEQKAA